MNPLSIVRANRLVAWLGTRVPAGFDALRYCYGVGAKSVRLGAATGSLGEVWIDPQRSPGNPPSLTDTIRVVVGDDGDISHCPRSRAQSGNASWVEIDLQSDTLSACSSLTGLPALYYAAYAGGILIATDIPSLVIALNEVPASEPLGVADTVRWGYPIEGRTVLADIRVLGHSSILDVDRFGHPAIKTIKQLDLVDSRSTSTLIADSISAFENAVSRMQIDSAFLSLSAGLDSRMVAVAASRQGLRPTCITLSSQSNSREPAQARAVCEALDLKHETLHLDDAFRRRLPALAEHCATLTGGVNSIAQCPDAFLYQTLAGRFSARVSGNLGNQVGHGGVESVPCQARLSLLDQAIRCNPLYAGTEPWYLLQGKSEHVTVRMNECMWYSLANNDVGTSFLPQLTPYADSAVMLAAIPLLLRTYGRPDSARQLRIRDIKHRLFGPSAKHSFQRQYLREAGSAINAVPINLGWHAAGSWFGSSQRRGIERLLATFILQRTFMTKPSLQGLNTWMVGRGPLTPLMDPQEAVRTSLQEMFLDTLHSVGWHSIGGIDVTAARTAIREHSAGKRDRSKDLLPIFQIALGQETLRRLLGQARAKPRQQAESCPAAAMDQATCGL